eukprot:gene30890-35937_t
MQMQLSEGVKAHALAAPSASYKGPALANQHADPPANQRSYTSASHAHAPKALTLGPTPAAAANDSMQLTIEPENQPESQPKTAPLAQPSTDPVCQPVTQPAPDSATLPNGTHAVQTVHAIPPGTTSVAGRPTHQACDVTAHVAPPEAPSSTDPASSKVSRPKGTSVVVNVPGDTESPGDTNTVHTLNGRVPSTSLPAVAVPNANTQLNATGVAAAEQGRSLASHDLESTTHPSTSSASGVAPRSPAPQPVPVSENPVASCGPPSEDPSSASAREKNAKKSRPSRPSSITNGGAQEKSSRQFGEDRSEGEDSGMDEADSSVAIENSTSFDTGAAVSQSKKRRRSVMPVVPHRRVPRSSWVDLCVQFVTDLSAAPEAELFLEPVDPFKLKIPDYFDVVKYPMNLNTVLSHLQSGRYTHFSQAMEHVALVFSNAKKYNPPNNPVYELASFMEEIFSRKFQKSLAGLELATKAAPEAKEFSQAEAEGEGAVEVGSTGMPIAAVRPYNSTLAASITSTLTNLGAPVEPKAVVKGGRGGLEKSKRRSADVDTSMISFQTSQEGGAGMGRMRPYMSTKPPRAIMYLCGPKAFKVYRLNPGLALPKSSNMRPNAPDTCSDLTIADSDLPHAGNASKQRGHSEASSMKASSVKSGAGATMGEDVNCSLSVGRSAAQGGDELELQASTEAPQGLSRLQAGQPPGFIKHQSSTKSSTPSGMLPANAEGYKEMPGRPNPQGKLDVNTSTGALGSRASRSSTGAVGGGPMGMDGEDDPTPPKPAAPPHVPQPNPKRGEAYPTPPKIPPPVHQPNRGRQPALPVKPSMNLEDYPTPPKIGAPPHVHQPSHGRQPAQPVKPSMHLEHPDNGRSTLNGPIPLGGPTQGASRLHPGLHNRLQAEQPPGLHRLHAEQPLSVTRLPAEQHTGLNKLPAQQPPGLNRLPAQQHPAWLLHAAPRAAGIVPTGSADLPPGQRPFTTSNRPLPSMSGRPGPNGPPPHPTQPTHAPQPAEGNLGPSHLAAAAAAAAYGPPPKQPTYAPKPGEGNHGPSHLAVAGPSHLAAAGSAHSASAEPNRLASFQPISSSMMGAQPGYLTAQGTPPGIGPAPVTGPGGENPAAWTPHSNPRIPSNMMRPVPGVGADLPGGHTATEPRSVQATSESRAKRTTTEMRGEQATTETRGVQAASESSGEKTSTESRGELATTKSKGEQATSEQRGKHATTRRVDEPQPMEDVQEQAADQPPLAPVAMVNAPTAAEADGNANADASATVLTTPAFLVPRPPLDKLDEDKLTLEMAKEMLIQELQAALTTKTSELESLADSHLKQVTTRDKLIATLEQRADLLHQMQQAQQNQMQQAQHNQMQQQGQQHTMDRWPHEHNVGVGAYHGASLIQPQYLESQQGTVGYPHATGQVLRNQLDKGQKTMQLSGRRVSGDPSCLPEWMTRPSGGQFRHSSATSASQPPVMMQAPPAAMQRDGQFRQSSAAPASQSPLIRGLGPPAAMTMTQEDMQRYVKEQQVDQGGGESYPPGGAMQAGMPSGIPKGPGGVPHPASGGAAPEEFDKRGLVTSSSDAATLYKHVGGMPSQLMRMSPGIGVGISTPSGLPPSYPAAAPRSTRQLAPHSFEFSPQGQIMPYPMQHQPMQHQSAQLAAHQVQQRQPNNLDQSAQLAAHQGQLRQPNNQDHGLMDTMELQRAVQVGSGLEGVMDRRDPVGALQGGGGQGGVSLQHYPLYDPSSAMYYHALQGQQQGPHSQQQDVEYFYHEGYGAMPMHQGVNMVGHYQTLQDGSPGISMQGAPGDMHLPPGMTLVPIMTGQQSMPGQQHMVHNGHSTRPGTSATDGARQPQQKARHVLAFENDPLSPHHIVVPIVPGQQPMVHDSHSKRPGKRSPSRTTH